MRPLILVGALSIALVASRGAAQGASTPAEGKTSDPHPAEQEGGKDIKGYGYGEQPGKSDTAAKQEAGADRERSAAPQDDRLSSGREGGPAGSATGEEDRSVVGRVVKAGAKSLSIRDEDRRVSRLRVDAKTRLLRDGKQVPVRSLRAGEEVRAAYDTRGGQRVATTITLVEKGASEPPSHTDQAHESDQRQEGRSHDEPKQGAPPGR